MKKPKISIGDLKAAHPSEDKLTGSDKTANSAWQ